MPNSTVNTQQTISGDQRDIFRHLEVPAMDSPYADLDISFELKGACAQALKLAERRGINRERLVDELNLLMPRLPKKITLRKVNAWMAPSKEDHPIPAFIIPAVCIATRCDLPLRIMANAINYELADQNELLAQELGQAEIERAATARRIRTIKSKLGESS